MGRDDYLLLSREHLDDFEHATEEAVVNTHFGFFKQEQSTLIRDEIEDHGECFKRSLRELIRREFDSLDPKVGDNEQFLDFRCDHLAAGDDLIRARGNVNLVVLNAVDEPNPTRSHEGEELLVLWLLLFERAV